MAEYSKGDRVSWGTPQGRTHGTVQEKKTSEFTHKDQKFNASDDEPYYVVESEKSGSTAAHKGSSLNQLKS